VLTTLSIHFAKSGVSATGLKSPRSVALETLGTGIIVDFFHKFGKTPQLSKM